MEKVEALKCSGDNEESLGVEVVAGDCCCGLWYGKFKKC